MELSEALRIINIHGLERSKEILHDAPAKAKYFSWKLGNSGVRDKTVSLDQLRQAIEVYEGRPAIAMYSNERGAAQVVINGQQISVYQQDWEHCRWRTPAERDQLIIDVALRRYNKRYGGYVMSDNDVKVGNCEAWMSDDGQNIDIFTGDYEYGCCIKTSEWEAIKTAIDKMIDDMPPKENM